MAGTQITLDLGPVQGSITNPVACVGTTLVGAAPIVSSNVVVIAASGQVAATLPANAVPGTKVNVLNVAATAVSATIFPAAATGKINNGSAGAAVSVAQNKTAQFVALDGSDNWLAIVSA